MPFGSETSSTTQRKPYRIVVRSLGATADEKLPTSTSVNTTTRRPLSNSVQHQHNHQQLQQQSNGTHLQSTRPENDKVLRSVVASSSIRAKAHQLTTSSHQAHQQPSQQQENPSKTTNNAIVSNGTSVSSQYHPKSNGIKVQAVVARVPPQSTSLAACTTSKNSTTSSTTTKTIPQQQHQRGQTEQIVTIGDHQQPTQRRVALRERTNLQLQQHLVDSDDDSIITVNQVSNGSMQRLPYSGNFATVWSPDTDYLTGSFDVIQGFIRHNVFRHNVCACV